MRVDAGHDQQDGDVGSTIRGNVDDEKTHARVTRNFTELSYGADRVP